jgi:hypothetical protein
MTTEMTIAANGEATNHFAETVQCHGSWVGNG